MKLFAIPHADVRAWWPLVRDHLQKACDRGVGDISPDTLLAECEESTARLLVASDGDTVPAAAIARFCRRADGSLACDLVAAGGDALATWKHVIPDIEAWARFHGAQSLRLCGRPGWARVFRGYRCQPVVHLAKDL